MTKYYHKRVMVDSNIFLEILLEQSGTEKCENILNELKEDFANCFVTPIIIKEIMDKIEEEINSQREPSLITTKIKLKSNELSRLLFHFHRLVMGMSVDFPGKDFGNILCECMTRMHVGKRDKVNMAFALAGDFNFFITCDEALCKEQDTINKIREKFSKPFLKILHVKR